MTKDEQIKGMANPNRGSVGIQEAQPEVDLQFLKKVLSVAIAGLYEHYKQDVLKTFSIDELSEVVDLSESLQPKQIEDIYKCAWEMLKTPPAAQRQWVDLTPQDLNEIFKVANTGEGAVYLALKIIKEKNT